MRKWAMALTLTVASYGFMFLFGVILHFIMRGGEPLVSRLTLKEACGLFGVIVLITVFNYYVHFRQEEY